MPTILIICDQNIEKVYNFFKHGPNWTFKEFILYPLEKYIQCYITCPFSKVDLIFGNIKKVKFAKQLERQFEWLETFSNKFQIDHFKCSFCSYWKKDFQHHINVSIEIYLSSKIMQFFLLSSFNSYFLFFKFINF